MCKDLVFAFVLMLLLSMFVSCPKITQLKGKSSTLAQSVFSEPDSACGTMMILECLRENQKNLVLQTQRIEAKIGSTTVSSLRPTDPAGGIDGKQHLLPQLYNTTHFVIHWTNGTDGGSPLDAVSSLDDNDTDGFPDYVEDFAEICENVRSFEVDIRGFHAPPSDEAEPNDVNRRNPDGRYDVFIYAFGLAGYAYPEQWPNSPSYSYIGVKFGYEGFNTPQLGEMQIVAAHEFFHAIQFYYDCNEPNWWLETSADYMEDEVYPDVNDNYENLMEWFQFSDTHGLESTVDSHQYGNFIFAKRLSEDFGDNIIREICEEMQKPDSNGLVAIDNALINRNSTLVSEFSRFITANFFLEDMYVDGADYRSFIAGYTIATFNGVWLEYEYDAAAASNYTEINASNVNRDAWMDRWATDYITMKLDQGKTKYKISFAGLDLATNYLVKLVTKRSGIISETMFSLNQEKKGYLTLSYDAFDNVTLIIANAGNTSTAKPSWKVTIEVVEILPVYDVAVVDLETSTFSARSGHTITFTLTLRNNGNTRSESFNVSTWWGDFLIRTVSIVELPPGNGKTLNISWTIPFLFNGSEVVWSNATLVLGEANAGNNRFENGMLTITIGIHDLAVTEIRVSEDVVRQSSSLNLNITAENQGDYTEIFNLTTKVNDIAIQKQTVTLQSNTSETIVFPWNTTDFPPGEYVLSAYVDPVPNETDTADNRHIGGIIRILPPIYDVAITDLVFRTVVGEGRSLNISVTAANQGTYTETLNITAYANMTCIQSQTVTLASQSSTLIVFSWNTTGLAKGNYTITAYALPVSDETEIADNTLMSWIVVTIPGDIDGNFKVQLQDLVLLAHAYGSKLADSNWDSNADVDGNNVVGLSDLVALAQHYGQHYP